MDDSSQGSLGTQQTPDPGNPPNPPSPNPTYAGYGQAVPVGPPAAGQPSAPPTAPAGTPAPAVPSPPLGPVRKNRGPLLFAAAGIVLLLILAVAAILVSNGNKAVACADSSCFDEHFAQCTPATYTYSYGDSSVSYSIRSKQSAGCTIDVRYLKSQYSPDFAGKTMTCEFDNTKSFLIASQNAFHYPLDYGCVGSLANEIKT